MSKNTTNLSDLPCTCGTLEQYVDGLCPGCIEAADRTADLNNECIYPQPTGSWEMPFLREDEDDTGESCEGACDAGRACHEDESAVREGDDDRFYSGSGESIGDGPDDDSYTRYLDRG
jgi:hypothetical protein